VGCKVIPTSRDTLGSRYTTPEWRMDNERLQGFLNTYRCPLEYHLWLREMHKFVQGQKVLSYPEVPGKKLSAALSE